MSLAEAIIPAGCLSCCASCPANDKILRLTVTETPTVCLGDCIDSFVKFSTLNIQPSVDASTFGFGGWLFQSGGDVDGTTYADAECSGVDTPFTDNFMDYRIICQGAPFNQWEVDIYPDNPSKPIFVARGTGPLPLNVDIPNEITSCNQFNSFGALSAGYGGKVKITVL